MKKRFFQKMFAFVLVLTMLGSIFCGAAVIPLDKETEAPAPFALSDVCSVTYRNGTRIDECQRNMENSFFRAD